METVPELTNEQKLDKIIDEAIIQNLPLEDKVAGLFITTPESITGVSAAVQAGDGTKDALSKYPVGGIVYAAKNIQSADQLKQMIDNTKLYTSYPLFIAIDGEGSGTDAVAAAGLRSSPRAPVQGTQARQAVRLADAALQRLGAQVNPKVVLSVFAAKLRTV